MEKFWKKLKHGLTGKCDLILLRQGNEKSGGRLFGGAYHWSKWKCVICGKESSSATESL